jgi:hypothetical protein
MSIAVARRAAIVASGFFPCRRSGEVMRIAAVLVLAAATAMPAAAQTAPVDALFEQFGLFGIWAADCQQPASPANPHVSITTPSPGLVSESHDLGPNYTINHYSMVSAERVSAEQLALFNQPDGGAVRVQDGIALAHGSKTPVLNKCE